MLTNKIPDKKRYFRDIWWFVPAVVIAGAVNGLLGAGGGIIMLYVIRAVLSRREGDGDVQKDTFASVVAVMLPVSLISAISYGIKGNVSMDEMQILTLPAIVGGIIGAVLTDRLPVRVVRIVFAVLVIISGVRMIF